MVNLRLGLALAGLLVILATTHSLGIDAAGMVRLKKAGVSDRTIEAMVRERTVETAAFSVEDILAMKAAGVGEGTLQALIAEGSFLRAREPIVYGSDIRSIRFATAADIVQLKQAGVGDEVLRAVVAASRPAPDSEREEALRLLATMGFWVEVRP